MLYNSRFIRAGRASCSAVGICYPACVPCSFCKFSAPSHAESDSVICARAMVLHCLRCIDSMSRQEEASCDESSSAISISKENTKRISYRFVSWKFLLGTVFFTQRCWRNERQTEVRVCEVAHDSDCYKEFQFAISGIYKSESMVREIGVDGAVTRKHPVF